MKNLLFSLALMLMTSFAFANTNEIKPVNKQMGIYSMMKGTDADKTATCKVTVQVGTSVVTISITCECTTIQACNNSICNCFITGHHQPKTKFSDCL